MEYRNHLDRLPVELHMYIADIIESDRRWHDWQKAKKHLEENFIRTLHEDYDTFIAYKTGNGKFVSKCDSDIGVGGYFIFLYEEDWGPYSFSSISLENLSI
jgi:hypothetical protein